MSRQVYRAKLLHLTRYLIGSSAAVEERSTEDLMCIVTNYIFAHPDFTEDARRFGERLKEEYWEIVAEDELLK
jgi:hypothetical protein